MRNEKKTSLLVIIVTSLSRILEGDVTNKIVHIL